VADFVYVCESAGIFLFSLKAEGKNTELASRNFHVMENIYDQIILSAKRTKS